MLRTVIEQYMRASTPDSKELRGDELCDAYAKTLSPEFNSQFPSFAPIYRKLSEAMHAANASPTVFKEELEEIDLHFKGRAIFAEIEARKKKIEARSAKR